MTSPVPPLLDARSSVAPFFVEERDEAADAFAGADVFEPDAFDRDFVEPAFDFDVDFDPETALDLEDFEPASELGDFEPDVASDDFAPDLELDALVSADSVPGDFSAADVLRVALDFASAARSADACSDSILSDVGCGFLDFEAISHSGIFTEPGEKRSHREPKAMRVPNGPISG